jgi:hypothetical protein
MKGTSSVNKLVAIGTPAYNNQVGLQYTQSLLKTRDALHEEGISTAWLCYGNVAAVPRMRNRIAAEALSLGATDLVFIDSDIGWNPKYFLQLLSHDVGIVGAVMPTTDKRSEDGMKFPFRPLDGKLSMESNGLAKVEALPTAFLRIRHDALQRLSELAPQVYTAINEGQVAKVARLFNYDTLPYGPAGEPMHTGEDFSFCNFARENGEDIWLDPNIPLTHFKQQGLYGSLGNYLARNM